ncbi:MAG: SpoIIE family protein phosphatase [Desulfobacterales bacterium]
MRAELDNLRESNEFLNLLLDNINSAVLIADENLRIHQFNSGFLNLFDRAVEPLAGHSFGQISGCVNAVQENRPCGETSQCRFCVLRRSLIQMLTDQVPVDRKRLERIFYLDGKPILKYLEFSARPVHFQGRKMILVIIYDITEIETQKRELERKQSQIDEDLQAASEIQKSLLPHHAPEIDGIRTAWRFDPCRQVGGDIFQIHVEDHDRICVYILDVCGHGVSAALVAVTVSQFLASLSNRGRLTGKPFSPEAVLNRLDEAFPLSRFDCFFTIAYASLNVRTGRLIYSNAGHVPPIVLKAGGAMEVLEHHGTVIGTGMAPPFSQAEKRLIPGDRLLLYTDGMIDNFGAEDDREKKERFYQHVRMRASAPIDSLVEGVMDQARASKDASDLDDDMSLLGIEFTG